MKTIKTKIKIFFTFFILFHLIFLSLSTQGFKAIDNSFQNSKIIKKLEKEIEITADSDFYIKFNSNIETLECKPVDSYSEVLTEKVKQAIAKSPKWIQRDLTRQFKNIDGEEYADLILNASKKYTDEIAFIIASSSIGNVPAVDVILDNVMNLYENDRFLKYVDIMDIDKHDGNYYSTVKYRVIEDNLVKQFEYPKEIYYWYIVHPGIAGEQPTLIYDHFWRSYITNHNDIGYPLLKEKLENINYLWDCKSYSEPNNRLWNTSIQNHPTAIEAISYWVGKTVPQQAYGDRPGQPSLIAHQHNGWCGELQKIAVAALRSGLIPTVGVCNHGEDHVWREFYERGWHQNDNWWADGGGAVDQPDVYAYQWGKDMSAVFAWKGDNSIYDVTSHYIHPKDLITIDFKVVDRNLQPVDGARVIVLVIGPSDITYIKHGLIQKIQDIWEKLPDFIKIKFLQLIFNKFEEKIESIPDILDLPITTTWNYTDIDGRCSFNLGKNREYLFLIQYGEKLSDLPGLGKYNKIRFLKDPLDKTYNIRFFGLKNNYHKHEIIDTTGNKYNLNIKFNTTSYQIHENPLWNDDQGIIRNKGKIEFFIVDQTNFEKYQNGKNFECAKYVNGAQAEIDFSCDEKNYYLVFKNDAYKSNIILDFTLLLKGEITQDHIQIVNPTTNIFENPIFNIGDSILFEGVANKNITLTVNDTKIEIETINDEWSYLFNTSELNPGKYIVTARCGDAVDELIIEIIDFYPPEVEIVFPQNLQILEKKEYLLTGKSSDNYKVVYVEISIDDSRWKKADGAENWSVLWGFGGYEIGEHTLSVRTYDSYYLGNSCLKTINISINESGHTWGPEIFDVYHNPINATNESNIIIYADIGTSSPFNIKKVVVYWDDKKTVENHEMYIYGNNPIQDRHEEDPLKNLSNDPIYGLELGQFPNETSVEYWIVAFDTANNRKVSGKHSFLIN